MSLIKASKMPGACSSTRSSLFESCLNFPLPRAASSLTPMMELSGVRTRGSCLPGLRFVRLARRQLAALVLDFVEQPHFPRWPIAAWSANVYQLNLFFPVKRAHLGTAQAQKRRLGTTLHATSVRRGHAEAAQSLPRKPIFRVGQHSGGERPGLEQSAPRETVAPLSAPPELLHGVYEFLRKP